MSKLSEPLQTTEAVHRLRKLDCCTVSDAFDRMGLTGVVTGVPRASGVGTLAGRVTTIKLGLGDPPPGPSRHLGTTAIEISGPDNVIVIEQRTGRDAGSWGGILTLGAVLRGVAGVLADGPVRDIDEARVHGFSIFTRSFTARTARGRVTEIGTNVSIIFEGVPVNPGDYVIADSSGIAFIPAEKIDTLLDVAEDIGAKETSMIRALRGGLSSSQVMGGDYEDLLKR
jgi:4-hydroxy-4-methyl-2-oxoglutarate aldolase